MPRQSFKQKRDKRDGRDSRDGRDRDGKEKRDRFWRKRVCRYCEEPALRIDFKDARALTPFINERGKILPRRVTSTCAYHQRQVTNAIKRARMLALLPYSASQIRWK